MTDFTDSLLGPLIIAVADLVAYFLVGRLGTRTKGRGVKYEPFAGGEKLVPPRGLYQSSLFIFATLFLVVETFALILAGSFDAPGAYAPPLFRAGGGPAATRALASCRPAAGGRF